MPPATQRDQSPRARVRRGNADDARQRRAELLAATMQLFSEGGLDAVSMRAVATKVGVSTMTPYYYFADKPALLAFCQQNALTGLLDLAARVRSLHDG